jgi:hypothetical protein
MWALTRTRLSVVTWSDPINDPVAEWANYSYVTEILKVIAPLDVDGLRACELEGDGDGIALDVGSAEVVSELP